MNSFIDEERFKFIDQDENTWYSKRDDDFKPNKPKFVEDRFHDRFSKVLDYDTITKLVSRSRMLREWYADVISDYILEVDVPEYFQDLIEPKQYKKLSEKVSQYNINNRLKSEKLQKASENYKNECLKIENEFKPKFDELTKDSLVKILTLNSEDLPIGLQFKLENYTAEKAEDPKTSALYSREMLVRYKIYLLEEAKKGQDIDEIIEQNQTKF